MRILFHIRFEKKYLKLSVKLKKQFQERLDLLIESPYEPSLNNHPLKGMYRGYYSINITGDLRAVYEFVEKNTIFFTEIDTHAKLYD